MAKLHCQQSIRYLEEMPRKSARTDASSRLETVLILNLFCDALELQSSLLEVVGEPGLSMTISFAERVSLYTYISESQIHQSIICLILIKGSSVLVGQGIQKVS